MVGGARGWLTVGLVLGCASRGGYAEPGPLSANANPPGPESLANGGAPGPSLDPSARSEVPPAIGPTGNPVPPSEGGSASQPPAAQACHTDTDCVPAECCHSTACVALAHAPACGGTMCSQECRPGTLDCGAARCACLGGACGVQRGH